MIGIYGRLKANEVTDLMLGINYRFEDAISPYPGLGYQNFLLGLSYDVNNSELGKAAGGTKSFEISFTWMGRRAGKPLRYLSCPKL